MANRLNADLRNRYVVIGPEEAMRDEYKPLHWRIYQCGDSFGCVPWTTGRMVAATCVADGEAADIRHLLERFATDDEVAIAYAFSLTRNDKE